MKLTLSRVFTKQFYQMRTLTFEAQPTNAFYATVSQMFSGSSQLPTMLSELNNAHYLSKKVVVISMSDRSSSMTQFPLANCNKVIETAISE